MRVDPPGAASVPPVHDAPSYPPEADWRAVIALRWQVLGLELVGISTGSRRKLPEVGRECQALAIVAAWFECKGNLTHTAAQLGISRRKCRERLIDWCRRNPGFMPAIPDPDFLARQEHWRSGRAGKIESCDREIGLDEQGAKPEEER